MGFDMKKYQGGGDFIKADEKQVLVDNGIPFTVTAIGRSDKFEKPQFVLTILCPDPTTGDVEERKLGFTIGSGADSRDDMLKAMERHFDEGGEPVEAKVVKYGRGFFLEAA